MNCALEYAATAAAELKSLPPELALRIHERLLRLAEDPVGKGRRVRAPVRGMLFGFAMEHEGQPWAVSVLFRYSADETRLVITAVGWIRGA